MIGLGEDFVSEVAGQIKLAFAPSDDEGAGQLLVRPPGQPPPASELTRLDHSSDANAQHCRLTYGCQGRSGATVSAVGSRSCDRTEVEGESDSGLSKDEISGRRFSLRMCASVAY